MFNYLIILECSTQSMFQYVGFSNIIYIYIQHCRARVHKVTFLKAMMDGPRSSFGLWKVCRKTKTRYYVDLTGAVHRDGAAFRQYLADKRSDHLARVGEARRELFSSVLEKCRYERLKGILRGHGGMKELQRLETWGISGQLLKHYHSMGVTQLFEWQVECLLMRIDTDTDTDTSGGADGATPVAVLQGRNLVYSAPTSGGKTLVAELLMLLQLARCWKDREDADGYAITRQWGDDNNTGGDILSRRGSVIFVVPFVSLAEEKSAGFQALWAPYGVRIRAYHGEAGDDGAAGMAADVDLAICTIEKANIIYTKLVESGRESQVRAIVIDELHMLADSHRGFILEILCSKLNYLDRVARQREADEAGTGCVGSSLCPSSVHLIGMSATLPNIADIGRQWLQAAVYITAYRPVKLTSYICIGRTLLVASGVTTPGLELDRAEKVVGALGPVSSEWVNMGRKHAHSTSVRTLSTTTSVAAQAGSTGTGTGGPPVRAVPDLLSPEHDADGFLFLCLEPMLTALGRRAHMTAVADAAAATGTGTGTGTGSQSGSGLHNVLVFCSSKVRCESCVARVVGAIKQLVQTGALLSYPQSFSEQNQGLGHPAATDRNISTDLGSMQFTMDSGGTGSSSGHASSVGSTGGDNYSNEMCVRLRRLQEARNALMYNLLTQTVVGLCPLLKQSLPYGVAYHHAGLTLDERKIIEQGYREGVISVLCTTSTLSAGVNLPATRVIIREPRMGNIFLSMSSYRQMCGRAGRTNLDAAGETFLIIAGKSATNSVERRHGVYLMTGELAPLRSSLHQGVGGGIEKLLLELICCERIRSLSDVQLFVGCTLLATQNTPAEVAQWTKTATDFLLQHRFISASTPSDGVDSGRLVQYTATAMGRATVLSGLAPQDATELIQSLEQARERFIIKGGFHAVFLATPPSFAGLTLNWAVFSALVRQLERQESDIYVVLERLGVSECELAHYCVSPPRYADLNRLGSRARFYRRVYTAVLLYNLIQEKPLSSLVLECIAGGHKEGGGGKGRDAGNRGLVQQLQKEASAFCNMVVVFCRLLNWSQLGTVVQAYSRRLYYGVRDELLPLVRISAELVPGFRARALYGSGLRSAEDIVACDRQVLVALLLDIIPYESRDPVTGAQSVAGGSNTAVSAGQGGGKERLGSRLACENLAVAIISAAKELLLQETQLGAAAGRVGTCNSTTSH